MLQSKRKKTTKTTKPQKNPKTFIKEERDYCKQAKQKFPLRTSTDRLLFYLIVILPVDMTDIFSS